MCSYCSKQSPYAPLGLALHHPWPSKRNHRFGFLINRRRAQLQETKRRKRMINVVKEEIKMRNLKLYMENQSIIEENEKLRKQAVLLHKENQTLLSQLQKKLSQQNNSKIIHH